MTHRDADTYMDAAIFSDASVMDAEILSDAESVDSGTLNPDAFLRDSSIPDMGWRDASAPDASAPDASAPDASLPDTGPPPCMCDDGLFCNGVETCDVNGLCISGMPPQPVDDGDPCTIPTTCNEATDQFDVNNDDFNPICVATSTAPRVSPFDYSYWYWPKNHRPTETWPTPKREMHLLTAYYGMALNEETGVVPHLGFFSQPQTVQQSLLRDNAAVDQMDSASLSLGAGPPTSNVIATAFEGIIPTAIDRIIMIDGGRFMNRLYVPVLRYAADSNLDGEFHISSMSKHLALTHTISGSSSNADTARISLGGAFLAAYPNAQWNVTDRALTMTSSTGEGWHFIVYDQSGTTTALRLDNQGTVHAERTRMTASSSDLHVSLVMIPTSAVTPAELDIYLFPNAQVQASSTLLDRFGAPVRAEDSATWDESLGAYRFELRSLQTAGAPSNSDFDQDHFHNWYGRHRIEVDTGMSGPVSVPMAFFGSTSLSWNVTGGVAILRDEQGEPLGVPVQISKNWHGPGNRWYHFYAHPVFSGLSSEEMEFTIASSRWGDAYAASHAQLGLTGWGETDYRTGRGHWDESALGCFGESVTYDPDLTLGRAMVDDVRPFLVQANQKWSWTGNVGGADFLRYKTETEPYWIRRMSRVRSHYDAPGPNVTDVTYAGVTTDGRIQGKMTSQLAATDDLVRVYYHLEYTFLSDVRYNRLAFFQVAADRYGDNLFTKYAYGNSGGVIQTGQVDTAHNTTGYESDMHRGIALTGDSPWVMLYDNQLTGGNLPEQYADIGFVVREFEVVTGTVTLTTPHINIHRTNNSGFYQYAFELGLPYQSGSTWCGSGCQGQDRFVPAGTTVKATVEYLIPPADPMRYYGVNNHLKMLPNSAFRSPDMMLSLARGNELYVSVSTGTLARTYPIEIEAQLGAVAADFTVTGGLGYTPISFHGLNRHDGWRLEKLHNQTWMAVDQSVHGNDYWQSTFDAIRGTWTQTFSVKNTATTRYRLVWLPPSAR